MKRGMRRAWKQDIARRKRKKKTMDNQTIDIKREIPAQVLSDILITAFDGQYGWSWNWFEPTEREDIGDGTDWLEKAHHNCPFTTESVTARSCDANDLWMKVGCRLKIENHTGYNLFDTMDGFTVTHETIAGAIQRIINDDYIGITRPATPAERHRIETADSLYGRKFWKEDDDWIVETGESARAYREPLSHMMADPEDVDIDSPFADAIIQVAIFGKVIFS